ncbi:MAG: transglycosylase SLT domain-containing protein [Polyangiaceae bacterium]
MSGRDGLALALLLPLAAATACGRRNVPAAPLLSASGATQTGEPVANADAAPLGAMPWQALVRDEQWDAAWRSLEALTEPERSRPEVRYVRARVALSRGDAPSALPLLAGIETALPLLADDVARKRAEAELMAGPAADAAEYFAARPSPSSQLEAARAFEKTHDTRRARGAVEKVLAAEKHTRVQEGEARALRLRLADGVDETDAADARWLAVTGADLPAASDALASLARVDAKHPLTAIELMNRARVLSDAGHVDEALRAIELAANAPEAAKAPRLERNRLRAMTLYRARGRWSDAAKALAECAAAGGAGAAEDAFHAARALSRADRDEEAIRAYRDVQRRYPGTTWARQAGFFVPYLQMLHGEWRECARGFDEYLHAPAPADEDARDARRYGALCKLLDGEARGARAAFEHLVEDEPDPLLSARMADMAALAATHDGDRAHAVARWVDVARSRPLSWPALVARARLKEIGENLPAPIDPPDPGVIDAGALAVTLPPPADLLHRLGLESDAEAALRERENLATAGAGGRALEALCEAYGELGRARRRYQVSQNLPSSLLATAPGPRSRWAWECAFPSPYADTVRSVEQSEKLPPGLLWAVMRQESGYDPDAVSPARAVGLMQLLPETAGPIAEELGLGEDDARLTSPPYALRVSGHLLRKLLTRFHGQVPLAVAAYNAGFDPVERWLSRAPGLTLDTFVERIPYKETREYVVRVMGNFARYGFLGQGDAGVPEVELALGGRP